MEAKAFLALLALMDPQALQEHLVIKAQPVNKVLAERWEKWDPQGLKDSRVW